MRLVCEDAGPEGEADDRGLSLAFRRVVLRQFEALRGSSLRSR